MPCWRDWGRSLPQAEAMSQFLNIRLAALQEKNAEDKQPKVRIVAAVVEKEGKVLMVER